MVVAVARAVVVSAAAAVAAAVRAAAAIASAAGIQRSSCGYASCGTAACPNNSEDADAGGFACSVHREYDNTDSHVRDGALTSIVRFLQVIVFVCRGSIPSH